MNLDQKDKEFMQYNENKFIQVQNSLKKKIVCEDKFNFNVVKTVAGVDLAYWNNNEQEYAVCCIVIIDKTTHKLIETKSYSDKIKVPYMPGFLAFRELPLVVKTAELIKHKPDLYMFDGNGCLHPRHMGIATHASFYLNAPTIGVAKTYYRVDKSLDYIEPDTCSGSYTDIVFNNEVYGRVLRTHDNVRPVFVSAGNFISLDSAVRLTMDMVGEESRIPIPTRLADLETHKMRAALRDK